MASNVTTAAETNVITTQQMARAREIDFVRRFTHSSLAKLIEALGVTRKIPMIDGTTMYYYTTTGTLESGVVPEGEIIPLSQYERVKTPIGEIKLKKWRKASTAEAILKSGYAEAVRETDNKLLADVQNGIRADFFGYLINIDATEVNGPTLQAVLAKSWGKIQVLFENDTAEIVHFIHPMTIADYLSSATITVQTAFGFSYIENFLGMGTVILNSKVPIGQVWSTAKENLIMYYVPVNSEAMGAFNMTADETGYVGIKSGYQEESRAQIESLVMSGIQFLVEYADGVVLGEVNDPNMTDATVAAGSKTSLWGTDIADIQESISVANGAVTGTLKYYSDPTKAIVKDWGPGYFLYVKFSGFSSGISYGDVQVGLKPSMGSGMQTLDSDADALLKITDKDTQELKIIQTAADGKQRVQYLDLSGLTLSGV